MKIKFTDAKGRSWEYDNVVAVFVDGIRNQRKNAFESSGVFRFAYFDENGIYCEEFGEPPTGDITIHVDEDEVNYDK